MDNGSLKKDGIAGSLFGADKHFGMPLLAVFIFNACGIPDSLAVFLLARPVSLLLHAILLNLWSGTFIPRMMEPGRVEDFLSSGIF